MKSSKRSISMQTLVVVMTMSVTVMFVMTLGICLVRYVENKTNRELYPQHYTDLVEENCSVYDLPQEVVYAVIRTESSFKADAVSSAGAKGLMQLTSATYEWIAWRLNEEADLEAIMRPEVNIRYGCYLLRYLYDRFGDWEIVYAAYNAGMNRVEEWLNDPNITENGKLVNIPYPETKAYVKKVTSARDMYVKLYGPTAIESK